MDRFNFDVLGGIDVDGLNFGSAKTNGLNVQSSASFTKFDDVTFTDALSGGRHMRIAQAGPVSISLNNVSFDSSFGIGSGFNVTLEDTNGGTDVKLHVVNILGAGAGRNHEEEINTALINWGNEVDWINASGGPWNTASNWSTGAVPVSTSEVFITLDGTYTITLDVDATVASLTLGGTTGPQTLSASGRTLTLNGAGVVNSNGALNLTGVSTLAGSGTLNNQGTVTLDDSTVSGALDNQGTLVARGVSNLNGAVTTGAGTMLRVLGNNIGQTASLTAANGFINNGTVELTSADANWSATLTVTSGTLVNASGAAIQSLVGASGSRILIAELDNQGTVTINQPLTINRTSANHQNSSNINLSGGSLTISSFTSFTNSGSIDAPTDDLTLSSFTSFTNTGTVDMGPSRTLTISGGTFNQNAGTFDVSNGTLSLSSATLNLPSTFTTGTLSLFSSTLNLTGSFTTANTVVSLNSSTFAATGTLTHAASGTLTLDDSTVSGALDNQGTLVAQGVSNLNGAVTTGAGTMLRVLGNNIGQTASLTAANGFINNGTVELTSADANWSATLTVTSGTLVNASGAAIQSLVGASGSRILIAELDNQGTVTVNQPLTINRTSPAHTNTGTVNIAGGQTLTISGGGTFDNAVGGTLQGTGTFNVSATTFSNAGDVNPGTSPGILSITGNFPQISTGVLNMEIGGLIAGTDFDQLDINGAATLDGTLNVSLISGFSPSLGDSFQIVKYTSGSGTFSTLNLPSVGVGLNWAVAYGTGDVTLTVIAVVSWASAVSGNWSDSTKWTSGSVPTAADDVFIDVDGTYTVTLDVSPTVASLTLGGATGAQTLSASGRTLTLNGASAVSGNGVLNLTSSTLAGSGTLTNAGTLTVTSGTINAALDNQGTLVVGGSSALNGALTTGAGSTLRVQGGLSGQAAVTVAGGFTNNGVIELTSTNSFNVATLTVTSGTLTNAPGAEIKSVVGAGNARTLTAELDNRGTLTVSQALTINKSSAVHTNTGTVDIASGQALTIAGGGTFDNNPGGIIQGTGTLNVSGTTFTNGGNVNPATSPGILNVTGNYTQSATGMLNIEIGGVNPGTEFDQLDISGSATLDGALNASLIGGFTPGDSDSFQIVKYASHSGVFGVENLPTLTGNLAWDITYGTDSIVLTVFTNQLPVLATNAGLTVSTGQIASSITNSELLVTDADHTAVELIYTVVTAPTRGTLKKSGTVLNPNDTFTQADVDANTITYDHTAGDQTDDSFDFTFSDGVFTSGAQTFVIAVNDAPQLTTNTGLTVNEGTTGEPIANSELSVTDADNTAVELIYTVVTAPTRGVLKKSGTGLTAGATFTQADIDTNKVTYDHTGSDGTDDSFDFTFSDGLFTSGTQTFNITVNAVPQVTNAGLTVDAGSTGQTITSSELSVTDADNTAVELIYTVVTVPTRGVLKKSGTALTAGATFTQADMDTDKMTYDHTGSDGTDDGFDFSFSDGLFTSSPQTFAITINLFIFTLDLSSGLNMISMPLKPLTPLKAADFATLLVDATLVIRYDTTAGKFKSFVVGVTSTTSPDNFDIDPEHAYIVNMSAARMVQIQGPPWGTPAAPPATGPGIEKSGDTQYTIRDTQGARRDGKWAFVVPGVLYDQEAPAHITVRNERTHRFATYAVTDGNYTLLLIDLNRQPVVEAGDRLEIAAYDNGGARVSGPFKLDVTPEHLTQAYLPSDLRWGDIIPDFTRLRQNYPNPFNPETWLPYELAEAAEVVITIYDVNGAIVRSLALGHQAAGLYIDRSKAAHWDGRNVAGERVGSGVYFYYFRAGEYQEIRKMVILK